MTNLEEIKAACEWKKIRGTNMQFSPKRRRTCLLTSHVSLILALSLSSVIFGEITSDGLFTGMSESAYVNGTVITMDLDDNITEAIAVKDGSNQGYTGYFSEPYYTPYKGNPNYRGYPRRSREALAEMVKKAHRAGYQIAIHGNGDAAIDDIIYAFEQAQKEYPRIDARHRIEHCQRVREDQLDKMKMLAITPSFFAGRVYYWGDRHRNIFMGPERAARISPLKSSVARRIRFTVHDDTPVTP